MNKKFTLFSSLLFLTVGLMAQTLVGTTPTNKNAIMEEFTGVRCGPCVTGHTITDGITNSYPGRVFVIGLHPMNSTLTAPYPGSPDLRRSWCDAFYTEPYYGNTGRSMPSAHINRKVFGTQRKLSTSTWSSSAASMLTQVSPVNVGISSQYNSSTQLVDVAVEMYFTSTVTAPVKITVVLVENNVIAEQYGGSVNYNHKHVLRSALTSAQWGDPVVGTTNAGDLRTMNFSFTNTGNMYNMNNCKIIAFVSNGTDLEIMTGMEVDANGGFTSVPSINSAGKDLSVSVYPNPVQDNLLIDFTVANAKNVEIAIFDIIGNKVYTESNVSIPTGSQTRSVNIAQLGLGKGLYLLRVSDSKNTVTKRIQVSN